MSFTVAVSCGGDDGGEGNVFDAGDLPSGDQAPGEGTGDDGSGGLGDGTDTGAGAGDAGGGDDSAPTATPDASVPDADDDDAGMPMDEEPEPPAEIELPSDGNALSVCATDDDCNGDDLVCVAYGFYRGYCADDCGEDADCPAMDGIEATCSGGRCIVDCEVDGAADGDCPQSMECAEISTGLLSSTFVCQYPEPKDGAAYATCDGLRGDSDCQEGLSCDVFVGLPLLSEITAPYCTESCMDETDCSDPGFGATPVCDRNSLLVAEGQCALECDNDRQCPDDMLCVDVNPLQKRCGYSVL